MSTLNVCVPIYMIKKNTQIHKKYKYFSSFQKLCQCIIKLQTFYSLVILLYIDKASEKKRNVCSFYDFVCFF